MRDLTRYHRQMRVPAVGEIGQARLAAAHVLIVGAGGLGCPVLQYLAGAGVGTLTFCDPDVVEQSNLHRQPLYHMADIGKPKVLAARDHLRATHDHLTLNAHVMQVDPANVIPLLNDADVVIDAADSFAVSYCLSDICLRRGLPLISASVLGQTGYVGGFCGGAPSLRAVFPDPPDNGASCATAGVLGPVVGIIGAMQAQLALQVLLRHDPSPLGHVISVDMARFHLSTMSCLMAQEPDSYIPFLAGDALSPDDRIFDLRDVTEAPIPAHPTARRISMTDLRTCDITDQRIVLCCSSGLRAWRAAMTLSALGHKNLGLFAAGNAP